MIANMCGKCLAAWRRALECLVLGLASAVLCGCGTPVPAATATTTPTAALMAAVTAAPTFPAAPTPSPTATLAPTAAPTFMPTATPTATPAPTATPTATPAPTATQTPAPTPTLTPRPTSAPAPPAPTAPAVAALPPMPVSAPARAAVRRLADPIPPVPALTEAVRVRAWGATVSLRVTLKDGSVWGGTGSVVGHDGLTLLTAFHVLGDPDTGELEADTIKVGPYLDWTLKADLRAGDPGHDLAALKVDSPSGLFSYLETGRAADLNIGDPIYTLSYPRNRPGNLELHGGRVLHVAPLKGEAFPSILTNADVGPGSSGGVAIDANGRLVGIIRAIIIGRAYRDELGYPELSTITVLTPVEYALPLLGR